VLLIINVVVVLGLSILALWCYRGNGQLARRVRPRSSAVIGGILVWWSFLLLPWLHLDVTRYLGLDSPLELASWEALAVSVRHLAVRLGGETVENALPIVSLLANPPGALLLVWRPTALSDVWLPAALIAAPAVALVSAVCTVASLTRIRLKVRMYLCIAQSSLAILAFVLLFLTIPALDAWGTQGQFPEALIAVLVGSHLGGGTWVALGGLVLLLLGGAQTYDALIVEQHPEAGRLADALASRVRSVYALRPQWCTAMGSILVLASFLLLPWVKLEPQAFADNLASLASPVDWLVEPLCRALETVGVATCTGAELDQVLFSSPDAHRSLQAVSTTPILTGTGFVGSIPWFSPPLQIGVLAAVSGSALFLLWSVASLALPQVAGLERVIEAACGLVAMVALLPGAYYHHMLDTMGTGGHFAISLLSVLAQSRVSYGAIVYLMGLLFMAIGAGQAALGGLES
jgi:hypothetical protein